MTSYQRERQALGQRLRELRVEARLTGLALADKAGWHSSKVSKIETGKQTPSRDDVDVWARICDASDELPVLVASLRSLESHYQEHRRQFRAGLAGHQRDYADLEARSDLIRNFESAFIPGLLQTPDYARARLAEAITHDGAPDDLDDAVAARMERQHVLYQPGKKFHILLTEAALRYRPCPPDIMAGQLDRLVSASTLSTVGLGVIPFAAPLPVVPVHGFWMFDSHLVRVETFTAELHITDTTELQSYAKIFAELARAAVYGSPARHLITRVVGDLAAA
ncbi:helix-turn-helix domain-containing protein [Jiangella muralis]|uniref:helix-turn-helix domain-containing protein n=1 Tax=Jiangella muralis TaxID=702383 RepID=UPI00069F4A0E|nr:helix-turn-helix transcriptional regulator [Jiangella muralis]